MFQYNNFKKILQIKLADIDQKKLIYFLSLMVGLLSALAAAFLKNAIHYTHVILNDYIVPVTGNYPYFLLPAAGMLLTVVFVKYAVKDGISHGISRVLYAISKKKGQLRAGNIWTSIIASTITIGFGGSVGAEAPIVLAGSSIGSTLGRRFHLNYKNITLLIGCGAAGAVSGIFKAPIAGIVFTLEILMLDLTISSIVPLLISSVTAATVAYFLIGNKVLFSFPVAEPDFLHDIPWYLLLGIVAGLISVYFSRMTLKIESLYSGISNTWVRIAIGGTILGILVYLLPSLYGEGYDSVKLLLTGNPEGLSGGSIAGQFDNQFLRIIVFGFALILLKVLASSSTNGGGGVGGIFAPTLFLGAVTGFVFNALVGKYFGVDLPDNRFVLVGMAGLMAGVMHAPLTAIFLIAEITGGYNLLIPLIIAATAAYVTVRGFEKHSIYHVQLAEKGELITHDKDKAVLVMMNWKKDIDTDLPKIKSTNTLGDLVQIISKSKRNIFPVVDQYNILEGVVVLDDVRKIMFRQELYTVTRVRELMTIPPSYIDMSENIESIMEAFEKTGSWNLPVLDNGYYVGFISKSRIYSTYREKLIEFSEE